MRRVIAVAGCGFAAITCAPTPPSGNWMGTIETRDGVEWVHNPLPEDGGDVEAPFTLHLEQTFGAEESPVEALLSSVNSVAVDDRGTVYIADTFNHRLVAFAADGSLLWEAGREGEGPGEFNGFTGSLGWDGGRLLYLDNRSSGQIDVWSTAGQFVGSKGLAEFEITQGWVAGFISPMQLVVRSWSHTEGDGARLSVFDVGQEWRRTAEFFGRGGRTANDETPQMWAEPWVSVAHGTVWVGNKLLYELREYDSTGKLLRVIERPDRPLIPYMIYRGVGLGLGEFGPPLWLGSEHALVSRYRVVADDAEAVQRLWDEFVERDWDGQAFETERVLDLLDSGGRILGSLALETNPDSSIGRPLMVGLDARLYTAADEPYSHVRRYRVEVHPGP